MKHYFFVESNQLKGPFTSEELKSKNLRPETMIWHEGLKDWTRASELDELKPLFGATPPPLNRNTAAPPALSIRKKSLPLWRIVAGTALVTALVVVLVIQSSGSPSSLEDPSSPEIDNQLERIDVNQKVDDDDYRQEEQAPPKPLTEEELRAALLKKELANSGDYLTADCTYRYRFFAERFEIEGAVYNAASLATFKDIVVTLIYYSNTNTELARKNYVLYEYVYPNSSTTFKWNVEAPDETKKISAVVRKATGVEDAR